MFNRKFGKIGLNTFAYALILTLTYIIVITLTAFTVHTFVLFTQVVLKYTFGLIFDLKSVITITTLLLTYPAIYFAMILIDKKLYKLRMFLKVENVYILKRYLPVLSIIIMLSIILGFLIVKDFNLTKYLFDSISNLVDKNYDLFINNFNDTTILERRSKEVHIYNWILYLPYTFMIYKFLLPSRKAFNFDFDDGIYINKEFIEFNKYYVTNFGSKENDKKHYFYDFFATFHIYKNHYKRLPNMDKSYIDLYTWYDDTSVVYVSKTMHDNYSIVGSTNNKTRVNAHYYLTNTNIGTMINELPILELSESDYDNSPELEEKDLAFSNKVVKAKAVEKKPPKPIVIDHYKFDPNYLYPSKGKVNVIKSIISSLLVAIFVFAITTLLGFTLTYLSLLLGLSYKSILVGIIRYASYLFIASIIAKVSRVIYKPFKLESFKLTAQLSIPTAIISFILYNASIFLAIEFDQTGNIIESLQNVISNYGELFIREITINIQIGSAFALPMFITVISKIVMFFTIYMTDFGGAFDFKGVYVDKEFVPFKVITVALGKEITVDEAHSKDFYPENDTVIKYFDQVKRHLVRCYEDTLYVDSKTFYNIYYGYCRSLQKTIVICTGFKDTKMRHGRIKRVPISKFLQEYLVYENEISTNLEKIKLDKKIANQLNLK